MKYCFWLLICSIFLSCAKDKSWLDEPPVEKANIIGQLINTDNGLPFQGVKILFERQVQRDGSNVVVDTVSTDSEGKFSYAIPYPNKVRVLIQDTGRYVADTVSVLVQEKKDYLINLATHPRFGVTQIQVNVVDESQSPMEGIRVGLYVRGNSNESYSAVDTFLSDNSGRILFENIAFPVQYKVVILERSVVYQLDSLSGNLTSRFPIELTLNSKAKFGRGDVILTGNYFFTNTLAANSSVMLSFKSILDDDFSTPQLMSFDNNGQIVLPNFVYPGEVKLSSAVSNSFPFTATSVVVSEDNIASPILVNLFDTEPRYWDQTPSATIGLNTLEVLTSGVTIQTMELDSKGNIYAVTTLGTIVKITPDGEKTTVATGFTTLWGIALVDDYTLYVSENSSRHAIYKVTIDPVTGLGTSSLFSGAVGSSGTTDGEVSVARYNRPSDLVYDKSRNCLWLGEWQNSKIRKIDLTTNQVSTVKSGIGFFFGVSLTSDSRYLYLASHTNNAGIYKYDIVDNKLYIVKTGLGSTRHVAVTPDDRVFFTSHANANSGRTVRVFTSDILVEATSTATANTGGAVAHVAGSTANWTSDVGQSAVSDSYSGSASVPLFQSGENGATGLIYDAYRGRLYVSDIGNQKVYIIKLTSSY